MYVFGEPVVVPRDADKETLEKLRLRLEKTMREITETADHYWDRERG